MARPPRPPPGSCQASTDDPALTDYWTERAARRTKLGLENRFIQTLAVRQRGRCARCGLDLVEGAECEPDNIHDWVSWFDSVRRTLNVHHVVHRQHGGGNELKNLILLHSQCHQQHHATEALDAKRSQ
ncbi:MULTISPECIES: HNH endonuclease signature motif containing protein [unclassified Streptomyces]|uniref:HNH endonuclease n=1 Tax=unclassified Streptomyces TaxID=2593676 RepID=UPI00344D9B5E